MIQSIKIRKEDSGKCDGYEWNLGDILGRYTYLDICIIVVTVELNDWPCPRVGQHSTINMWPSWSHVVPPRISSREIKNDSTRFSKMWIDVEKQIITPNTPSSQITILDACYVRGPLSSKSHQIFFFFISKSHQILVSTETYLTLFVVSPSNY